MAMRQEYKDVQYSKVKFGKHKGKYMFEVPDDYVEWAILNLNDVQATWFSIEWSRRKKQKVSVGLTIKKSDESLGTSYLQNAGISPRRKMSAPITQIELARRAAQKVIHMWSSIIKPEELTILKKSKGAIQIFTLCKQIKKRSRKLKKNKV